MKLFRWILSYLGVMVVIIAVVLGYVYRKELMAWFDASDRQLAQTVAETTTPGEGGGESKPEAPAAAAPQASGSAGGTTAPGSGSAPSTFPPLGYEPPGPPPAAAPEGEPGQAGAEESETPAGGAAQTPAPTPAPAPLAAKAPIERSPSTPPLSEPGSSAPAAPVKSTEAAGGQPGSPTAYGPYGRPMPPAYAESWSSARAGTAPPPGYPPRLPMPAYPRPPMAGATPPAQPKVLGDEQRDALTEARETFWAEGPEAALPLYQALAEANADNPDIQGELANIYFNLGQRSEAAEAYVRVVELLDEQGRRGEAARVVRIVAVLDPERASSLVEALSSPPSTAGETSKEP